MCSYKILIIEDEYIIANQLKTFLIVEGYTPIGPVDNYEDAIKIIVAEVPDLIIADIRLYDDNDAGIRISEFVSSNYNIPLIFLSGYSDKETLIKAKITLPNTYLIKPKPLDKAQLLATVEMALPSLNTSNSKLKNIFLKGKESIIDGKRVVSSELKSLLININAIRYIEAFNHRVKNTCLIHFTEQKAGFLIRYELEDIQSKLPIHFKRVHKSYVVNANHITAIQPDNLYIGNLNVPIGDRYKNEIISCLPNISSP